jgi:CSLREA domain-containing protein
MTSAAVFTVNSIGDEPDDNLADNVCHTAAGTCTLRAAIQQANATGGANVVHFNISGGGVHTIRPAFTLDPITTALTIDGYSQPGSSPNTLAVGENAVLTIELDGSLLSGVANGLTIQAGGCTIKGLVINRFTNPAILLDAFPSAGGNKVRGNFLGTDPAGAIAMGNAGIGLWVRSPNNTIGGPNPADRNVITATRESSITAPPDPYATNVSIEGSAGSPSAGNVIQGNYIGTDASGTAVLSSPNGAAGIVVTTANSGNVTIGGPAAGAGNVISGNAFFGLEILSTTCTFPTTGVVVEGNFIGTDVHGAPLGNGYGGIHIGCNASNNTIGGTAPGAGNVIANNGAALFNGAGVVVDILGRTGTGSGAAGTGNAIRGNSIFSNTAASSPLTRGLGIDLIGNGPTPNDSGDGDTGPNNLQNFPVLSSATSGGGSTTIAGTLNSAANTTFAIDFYASPSCDPSGYGEGRVYLGSAAVATNGVGNAGFSVALPVSLGASNQITATATDPNGNTSEFSACLPASGGRAKFFTVTPCRVADTRGPAGPYGAPALSGGGNRTFVIGGQCGIPAGARAVAFNFTVTQGTGQGDIRAFPGGTPLPLVSTLNWAPGRTRANNAVTGLGASADLTVHVDQPGGTVQIIIDVTGYFQ